MYQIGERFGDYEIVQILGAGGMGQVFKVRNVLSDRFEAMKVLLPNLEQKADLADRFLREIKVQAGLHHKNIASLHTAQRQGEKILMFIEFVDGITLDKGLQRGSLAPELAVNIISQVLEALAYAHSRGVVHRDIKPENIMVLPEGTVKLMDFGIARLSQDRRLTSTGSTVGSLYYMSPEQIRGADDLDGRSDLYSLGITLYQCLTGKRPFDGDSDFSIMTAHISHVPPPPLELDPRVPQALNDVVMMAIAKDRRARYQSADEFRIALQNSIAPGAAAVVAAPPVATRVQTAPLSAAPVATIVIPPPPPPRAAAAPYIAPPHALPVAPVAAGPHGGGSKAVWIGLAAALVLGAGCAVHFMGPEWMPGAAKHAPETQQVPPTRDGALGGGGGVAGVPSGPAGDTEPKPAPPPPPPTQTETQPPPPRRIRVAPDVQTANLIRNVTPVYPPLAKQAGIQGTVRFSVVISREGQVENLQLVAGHPMLVPSATDAIKQWAYKPTLLNGEPVEVISQVEVNYILNEPAPTVAEKQAARGARAANTQQAPPPQQQQQALPPGVRPSYQLEPQAPNTQAPNQARPQVDPQVAREMAELRHKFNDLATRFSVAQEAVKKLEMQQMRQGLGLRRDIKEAVGRFQYLMKESADSLTSRDFEAAKSNLQNAERNLERVEKFLGN